MTLQIRLREVRRGWAFGTSSHQPKRKEARKKCRGERSLGGVQGVGRRAGVRCASRATSTRKRRYGPLARSTQTRALRINGRSIPSTHLSRRCILLRRCRRAREILWTGGALPWNFTTAHLQRERGIQDGDTTGNAGRSLRGGSENEREGERSYSFAEFVAYGQLENVKDGICRVHEAI